MSKSLRKNNTLNLLLIYLTLFINHTKPIKIEKKNFKISLSSDNKGFSKGECKNSKLSWMENWG